MLYDAVLKPILQPSENNRYVAIHVPTGDFAVGISSGDAIRAILTRQPADGQLVVWKIGARRDQMQDTQFTVFNLSPAEKLQLVEDLWDDLSSSPGDVPVLEWHKEELARRKANLQAHPEAGLSWEEVQRRVRSHYGH